MKLPRHLTLEGEHLNINSRPRCPGVLLHGTQAALMRREETTADITAAMEHPPGQK
ncbi:MAG: hypothetical protein WC379_05130 [Methanoregula sp.]